MSELTQFLNGTYDARNLRTKAIVDHVEDLWSTYAPFADPSFLREYTSGDPSKRQQRYWEMFLATYFYRQGARPISTKTGIGPDIKIDVDGRTIWIEATSPGRGTGKNAVPDMISTKPGDEVRTFKVPDQERLLRITSALEEKVRKFSEYQAKELIGSRDLFFIALDSSQLGPFEFEGISGFPAAVEAVYPVGEMQVTFAPQEREKAKASIRFRPEVKNANNAAVPTMRFLDPASSGISGIIFSSRCEYRALDPSQDALVVIHNKVAANSLRPFPLKIDYEIHAEEVAGGIKLVRVPPN